MSTANESNQGKRPEATPAKWWQTRRARQVGAGTLVVLALGALYWALLLRPYVSTDDARVAATLVRVAPEGVSGEIVKLNVTEGSRVKQGDVLVELDHRTADAQLERAKAKAQLAQRELRRIASLAAQKGVPPRDLDVAQANADTADAELRLAQVNADNTTIRSPIDGVVVQKSAEIGNIAEAGQTLVTVADVDRAWIAANVEETSVGDVKPGQPVSVSVDEGGDLHGKVLEVRSATAAQFSLIPAENPSGNFTKLVQRIPIKVALDPHPDRVLRVGQSVEIKIKVR